jgi:acylphosphatase
MSDIFPPNQDRSEDAPARMVGRLVHYSGRVQGVGFRATASAIARGYQVTGWVRNLPDGRVQLLAEGAESEVDRFLDAIRTRWGRYIENVDTQQREPTGKYRDFAVAR